MKNIAHSSLSKTAAKFTFKNMQTEWHIFQIFQKTNWHELNTTICAGTSNPLLPRAQRFKELQAKSSASANHR